MTRQRIWLAVVGAVVAAVVAVVLVLRSGGTSQPAPLQPVSGEASLSRSGALFADPLRATIEVIVDRGRVDPSAVGFDARFEPYVRVGIPRLSRHDAGRVTRLVYSANLVCLTDDCLPKGQSTRVQFPPARIFYWVGSGAKRRTLELSWLPLTVAGRTSQTDLVNSDPFRQPRWHATAAPAAVSYSISPSLLQALLFAGGGVLLAGAVAAFVLFLRVGSLRLRFPALSPLERALTLVERTSRDDPSAKRKALELLSRELARSGEGELALAARELAWAEPTPVSTATQPLTLDVRRVIEQRSNGHAR